MAWVALYKIFIYFDDTAYFVYWVQNWDFSSNNIHQRLDFFHLPHNNWVSCKRQVKIMLKRVYCGYTASNVHYVQFQEQKGAYNGFKCFKERSGYWLFQKRMFNLHWQYLVPWVNPIHPGLQKSLFTNQNHVPWYF